MPNHQRSVSELANLDFLKDSVHLYGDAKKYFKTIIKSLKFISFDTAFPVKHGELISGLGDDTIIYGGPHVKILWTGTKKEIEVEIKRIFNEVKGKQNRAQRCEQCCSWNVSKSLNAMY